MKIYTNLTPVPEPTREEVKREWLEAAAFWDAMDAEAVRQGRLNASCDFADFAHQARIEARLLDADNEIPF